MVDRFMREAFAILVIALAQFLLHWQRNASETIIYLHFHWMNLPLCIHPGSLFTLSLQVRVSWSLTAWSFSWKSPLSTVQWQSCQPWPLFELPTILVHVLQISMQYSHDLETQLLLSLFLLIGDNQLHLSSSWGCLPQSWGHWVWQSLPFCTAPSHCNW